MTCPNPNCLYLHEQGEDMDTISKEELATGYVIYIFFMNKYKMS